MEIIQLMSLYKVNMKTAIPVVMTGLLLMCCGCLTYSFGDVSYDEGVLDIEIFNDGDAREVAVQVTVFDLAGFRQNEIGRYVNYVQLESGENEYSFPLELNEGSYKLYLYVLEDGRRSSAVIRDIVVK